MPASSVTEDLSMKRTFSTKEAAVYIGTTEQTLRASRCPTAKIGFKSPVYRRMGTRKIIYLIEDLDEYLDKLERQEPVHGNV